MRTGRLRSELSAAAPGWGESLLIDTPIKGRDFETADARLTAALAWARYSAEADARLPEMEAVRRASEGFASAASLEDLQAGARLAEDWATAAVRVADAIAVSQNERDMMTDFGMFGTDLTPLIDRAIAAAQAGDVAEATQRARSIVEALKEGERNGGLRLAGIVFLIVAVIGVIGLWWLFRRNQGPPWARNSRPPWAPKQTSKKPSLRKTR